MNPQQLSVVELQHNRAEYKYIHNGSEGISTAFELSERAELILKIPRALGTVRAILEVYNEGLSQMLFEIEGEWQGSENGLDIYCFYMRAETLSVGLYFIRPRISIFAAELFGHKWDGAIYFDYRNDMSSLMQMTLCDFKYPEPTKIRGGVIYHIFVDRFKRGGNVSIPDGARVIRGVWSAIPEYPEYPGAPLYNNTFYGGTLWGIIEKLDYIKSLGTTAIYLSPIFRAASNHKYDTADYMTVDPIFGGDEAFRALICEAKLRDIEIILDGVFNHTGSDSIYFNRYGRYQQIGAFQSRRSEYYDWYEFQQFPRKYTSWWGIDILPRINPDFPTCREFFVGDDGVIDKYSRDGIYGFRLDVADELSDNFISEIKKRLVKNRADSILYGEVWEDASNKCSYGSRRRYYYGDELDGVMNYPLRSGIIDYLTNKGSGSLAYALKEVTSNAPRRVLHNQMNLLGTHDTVRIITALADMDISGFSNHQLARLRMPAGRKGFAQRKLILAYTILSTMPGIPTVFYGDEAGLEGFKDPFNRMPYPWGRENPALIRHYTEMGRIRRENAVYSDGDFKLLHLDDELLVFLRTDGVNNFITVVNNKDQEISLSLSESCIDLFTSANSDEFKLEPYSAGVYKACLGSEIEIS